MVVALSTRRKKPLKEDPEQTPSQGDGGEVGASARRLERIEAELERLKPSLLERLRRLEDRLGQRQSFREWCAGLLKDALPPILSGVVILWLGYLAKDSFDQAIRRQQVELAYAKEMQGLLLQLSDPNTGERQAIAAATTLTAFGSYAVIPLIHELQADDDIRPVAAQEGLRALALKDREGVCQSLEAVLRNRTQLYCWQTHKNIIGLLGEIGCREALSGLEDYQAILEGKVGGRAGQLLGHDSNEGLSQRISSYRSIVCEKSPPDEEALKKILQDLKETKRKLEELGSR